jgi:mannose-6-phosphate isomerase-like protein (cupin superfamily)
MSDMPKKVEIVEVKIEGQSPEQEGRGAFESWFTGGPKYWKKLVVKPKDRVPVINKAGDLASGLKAAGAKGYHVVSTPTTGALSIRNAWYEFPPGSSTPIQWNNAENSYYVVQGTGYIEINGERHDFEPGDGVFVPLRQKHRIVNNGKILLQLVEVTSMVLRPMDDLAQNPIDYREFREKK